MNDLHPSCYIVSKILDVEPVGVIKLSLKLDQFNPKRDSVELKVCDYYNDTGDIIVDEPVGSEDPEKTSVITYMEVNSDGELEVATAPATLDVGKTYYYSANFSNNEVKAEWRIKLVGEESDSERILFERLMVIRDVNDTTISLTPGKASKIKGRTFKLEVCDINGDYESNIEVEVSS